MNFFYIYVKRDRLDFYVNVKKLLCLFMTREIFSRESILQWGIEDPLKTAMNKLIPREARPKASRSGVYNFVPQRAQAG